MTTLWAEYVILLEYLVFFFAVLPAVHKSRNLKTCCSNCSHLLLFLNGVFLFATTQVPLDVAVQIVHATLAKVGITIKNRFRDIFYLLKSLTHHSISKYFVFCGLDLILCTHCMCFPMTGFSCLSLRILENTVVVPTHLELAASASNSLNSRLPCIAGLH